MQIWQATHDRGWFSERTGIAEIVTATLWGVMTERLPLKSLLEEEAPAIVALTDRVRALPSLAKQAADSRGRFGSAWCGGEIEKSLRRVL